MPESRQRLRDFFKRKPELNGELLQWDAARHKSGATLIVGPSQPPQSFEGYRRLGAGPDYIGTEIRQLPATIKAFPQAFRDTQQKGKQADSFMGFINSYSDSLNPFGGGIPTQPIAGNTDAYQGGQGLGNGVGFVVNTMLTVSGVRGTITAVENLPNAAGKVIQVAKVALETGETVPVAISVDGEAVLLTLEAAGKLGLPASKAVAGEVNLINSVRNTSKTPPNPDGSVGKADHREAVDEMVEQFKDKYPKEEGFEVRTNKSIEKETGLNRRPDAAALKDGNVVEVGEVARTNQDSTLVPREVLKQRQYKAKGIPSTIKTLPKQ